MIRVPILLPLLLDRPFTYAVPEGMTLAPGDYVRVPLGRSNKEIVGVVWDGEAEVAGDAKPVAVKTVAVKAVLAKLVDVPPMSEAMRRFLMWAAWYNVANLGMVLKLALSVPAAFEAAKTETVYRRGRGEAATETRRHVLAALGDSAMTAGELAASSGASRAVIAAMAKAGLLASEERAAKAPVQTAGAGRRVTLTGEQAEAASLLAGRIGNGFSVSVLDGVTGSGKTEVYFEAVEAALAAGRQVLVLLPEIGLSVQWLERCERRFGIKARVWHSAIAEGARRETWRRVADGSARLVVGARSALFLPYADLGLIVVDEEHDGSFKQEEGVHYQGRDMAVARGNIERVPVILVSATPSLETLVNIEEGKYAETKLRFRPKQEAMPQVSLLDLRQEKMRANEWISDPLREKIASALRAGQQTLLFLNRRGYAPLLLCRKCGHRFGCPQCSAWLVWHRHRHELQCHHCDYREPSPARCPACHDPEHLAASGPGIERLEEEVLHLFPTVRLLTLSSETMQTPKQFSSAIRQIENSEIDIVIGTQLLAKGHHFPGLSLVGIVDGDLGLFGGDFRSSERTWQLLHQLSGRAGRGGQPGEVLLQTTQPEHPVMQALLRGDRDGFLALEKAARREHGMPPYGRLAAIVVESLNEERAREAAGRLARNAPAAEHVTILGPAPAPYYKLRNKYRHRFLIEAPKSAALQTLIGDWLSATPLPGNVEARVDIDPYSFL